MFGGACVLSVRIDVDDVTFGYRTTMLIFSTPNTYTVLPRPFTLDVSTDLRQWLQCVITGLCVYTEHLGGDRQTARGAVRSI